MGRLTLEKAKHSMDQSDIKYIIEQLTDAIANKDWDIVEEANETLKEFLDSDAPSEED